MDGLLVERHSDPMTARRDVLRWLAAATAGTAWGCGGSSGDRDAGSSVDGGFDAGTDPDGGFDAGDATPPTCSRTSGDATGPFFEEGAPMRTVIAEMDEPGERLLVEGRVMSAASCTAPLAGHVLDFWQADAGGNYHEGLATEYRLRGKVVTDADGRFSFETIKPGNYPLGGSFRPAHLHLRAYDPEGRELLTTQVYFEGDRYLFPDDPCAPPGCRSDDPARILRLDPAMVSGRVGLATVLPLFL